MYIKCNDGITSESLKVKLLVTRMSIMPILSYRIKYMTVKLYSLTGILSQLVNAGENRLFVWSDIVFSPQFQANNYSSCDIRGNYY